MVDLLTAFGLFLVIEGIVYGAFPKAVRRLGEFMRTTSDDVLRIVGLFSAAVGLGVIWLARSWM